VEGADPAVRGGGHSEVTDFESAECVARLEGGVAELRDAQKAERVGEAGDICFNGGLRRVSLIDVRLIVAVVGEFGNIALSREAARAMAFDMEGMSALMKIARLRLEFENAPDDFARLLARRPE